MSSRPIARRVAIGVAALVVVLLVAVVVTGVVLVRRPFPDHDGTASLPGLSSAVTVQRDDHGIPQIYADDPSDLFRAQGYVQAQDRFFEMDWRRHVTAGRISELVGADADALAADKVVRTLGWRRVAQAEFALADPATRTYLQAYADGVNAYLSHRSAASLALDYSVLALAHPLAPIEPWTPVDSLAWFTAMAWDLRGNYDDELTRARLLGVLHDRSRVEQLYPPYPYDRHAPILPALGAQGSAASPAIDPGSGGPGSAVTPDLGALVDTGAQRALDAALRAVHAVPRLLGGHDGVGSNSWVVSGALTASGKPMLANDPHLAPSLPGVWYQMGLHCRTVSRACPFDVAGFTFSGVPGVIIGHTGRISWGITNLGPDVTDFYLERVTAAGYERDGMTKPLLTRQETIRVAGGDPVTITVRATGHGPILSDVLDGVGDAGPGYAVSLAWTALIPGHDMDAILGVDSATDFASFRTAVLRMDAPAQNFVYADVDGHIGYQAPGRIPLRRGDGRWPLPGWQSRNDWTGFVPLAELPSVEDPAEGFIVASNQAVTGPDGPVAFGSDVDYGYRSQRVRDLLAQAIRARHPLTVADLQAMQGDSRNGIAAELLPLLRSAKVDPFTAQGVATLANWDLTQPEDSAAAAFFNVVWEQLLDLTFADELPAGTRPNGGGRWYEVMHTLLKSPQDPWWDDHRTANVVETRDAIIREALVRARLRLTQLVGKDPSSWTWGTLHRLRLERTPLGATDSTSLIHRLLDRGPLGLPGGPAIVDANGWDASSGSFAVDWAPSMRMIVDLAQLDGSRWVNQTGESGHPGQQNYADQLGAWSRDETFAWPFTKPAVDAATTHTLTLR